MDLWHCLKHVTKIFPYFHNYNYYSTVNAVLRVYNYYSTVNAVLRVYNYYCTVNAVLGGFPNSEVLFGLVHYI